MMRLDDESEAFGLLGLICLYFSSISYLTNRMLEDHNYN